MTELNVHKYRLKPYRHQVVGVQKLVEKPAFALFDEMGLGKTKQALDAACELFIQDQINLVLIICPASLMHLVWGNPVEGEIKAHVWVPHVVYKYHSRGLVKLFESQPSPPRLGFVITSYEFTRKRTKVRRVWQYPVINEIHKLIKDRKTFLIVDESSAVAYHGSIQTKSTYHLRQGVKRVVELNGTPVSNNPTNLYAQFKILDPAILGFTTYTEYFRYHCIPHHQFPTKPIGYLKMEELQEKTAPYVLRRTKDECLDLPPKTYIKREVSLTKNSWRLYKEMRDEMVAWLDQDTASVARQAIVKMIRLAQLTSGMLGGFEEYESAQVVGSEKRDYVMDLLHQELPDQSKIIVWSRFRLEQKLLAKSLEEKKVEVYRVYGGQPEEERKAIQRFADKEKNTKAVLLGQPRAGGIGLNLTSSALAVYISTDYSLLTRLQSEDRIHRIGQTKPCTILDVLATGPEGQKTVDHAIVTALKSKEDVANWTCSKWKEELLSE